MKTVILFGVMVCGLVAVQSSADARERLRKNETYCLETPMGGFGGGSYTDCRFSTLAQCNATRMGVGGWCLLNPAISYQRRDSRWRGYND